MIVSPQTNMSDEPKNQQEKPSQREVLEEQIKNRELTLGNERRQVCGENADDDDMDLSGTISTGPKAKLDDE